MTSVVSKVTWLLGLFNEFGVLINMLVMILSHNKSTIQLAANLVFHVRTKHIEIDFHFIWNKSKEEVVDTVYVHTQQQVADLLTKELSQAQH